MYIRILLNKGRNLLSRIAYNQKVISTVLIQWWNTGNLAIPVSYLLWFCFPLLTAHFTGFQVCCSAAFSRRTGKLQIICRVLEIVESRLFWWIENGMEWMENGLQTKMFLILNEFCTILKLRWERWVWIKINKLTYLNVLWDPLTGIKCIVK